eukprot:TRINITY_DN12607_c0_g1_i1.p1 TRINITY_DN12607_c0_g1~~TRINITY_DN12607_c0_g1_i1.p1  ORF type:complete len:379 (+),score=30.45 TRINITY_DN12607_c0_g1_i1:199-1335(+)
MLRLQDHGAGSFLWRSAWVVAYLAIARCGSVAPAHGVLRRESQPELPHSQTLFAFENAADSPSRKTPALMHEMWKNKAVRNYGSTVHKTWQRGVDLLNKPLHPVIDRDLTEKVSSPSAPKKPIKLVLGVMAITGHADVHEAHRQTWMKSPGVCQIARWNDPACNVFPLFVLGKISKQQRSTLHFDDYFVLEDVPETAETSGYMGEGGKLAEQGKGRTHSMWLASQFKTPAFFSQATSQFPWATHFGKMDEDTLVNISAVADELAKLNHIGGEWHYGHYEEGGYSGKGVMMGEFYVLSKGAASCWLEEQADEAPPDREALKGFGHIDPKFLVRAKRFPARWWATPEDQIVSTLTIEAQEHGNCPPVHWIHACHWRHPVS